MKITEPELNIDYNACRTVEVPDDIALGKSVISSVNPCAAELFQLSFFVI